MDGSKAPMYWIPSFAAFLVIAMLAQSCAQERPGRTDLDYFKRVSHISLSSGGRHLAFTGCGRKDYPGCTIYRFDREQKVLYRYLHPNSDRAVLSPRYWSDPDRFIFFVSPRTKKDRLLLDDMQIAIMNRDGNAFKVLTEGKGVKTAYMISPDGKTLVYARGKERTSGRTPASWFDYYARDLGTGRETRLTRLTFYEVSTAYFTPDGKNIVFINGSPKTLPGTDDSDAVTRFRNTYNEKYKENKIIQYPVDGSGVDRPPEGLRSGVGRRVQTEGGMDEPAYGCTRKAKKPWFKQQRDQQFSQRRDTGFSFLWPPRATSQA